MIKLYTITIIIITIKLGATDRLKIEPLGIMHKLGQRARPQGSASFTGWTEGMSKFGQNYFTKQGSLLLQDELNICRGYCECDARNIMKQISCTKRSGSGWSRRDIVQRNIEKEKVYLYHARNIMQEIFQICNKYYAQRDQAVDGVEGALCRQNDGVGSARLRLTVHTANTDTQNTKYWQQKNANTKKGICKLWFMY